MRFNKIFTISLIFAFLAGMTDCGKEKDELPFWLLGLSGGGLNHSSQKEFTDFSLLGQTGTIGVNTIGVTVPYGTDPSSLVATFTHTGASVNIAGVDQVSGTTVNNFTSPQIYTVVALDGSTKDYTVTVTVALNPAKNLTAFSILGQTGIIDSNKIKVTVPYGTDPSSLVATFTHTGASVNIAGDPQTSSTTVNSFTSPQVYTVVAADGSTKDYTVTVTVAAISDKDIIVFSILGQAGVIGPNGIWLTVPSGTDLSLLVATFTHAGASVNIAGVAQVSGTTVNNFTSPVVYTVVAADGSTKNYTVKVTADTTAPQAVTGLSAIPLSGTQIHLNWNTVYDNPTPRWNLVYEICQSLSSGGCDSFTVSYTTGAGQFSYDVTGLDPSTAYYFRVRAKDAVGNTGSPSSEATATTLAAAPSNSSYWDCVDARNQTGGNDGVYTIDPDGLGGNSSFEVYCHDMAGNPREYLELVKTGGSYNFSKYKVGGARTGTDVVTSFTKVRIDPYTLMIDLFDLNFATSTGQTYYAGKPVEWYMPYGYAADCITNGSSQGHGNINLVGTRFAVDPGVTYVIAGSGPAGSAMFNDDRSYVEISGGGYCGENAPNYVGNSFALKLSLLAGSAPALSYSDSPFTFTKDAVIAPQTPILNGNTPATCTSSPPLPAGLSIDSMTCAISGTPTAVQSASDYTITATNAFGSGQTIISITVVQTYTIGGTVSGLLSGTSVVLRNNGGDDKTVSANAAFTFTTPVNSGATYDVTIFTQPTNTRCIVQNGSGTANAAVTNIIVTCPVAVKNGLAWMRCTHGQAWNAAAGDCTGAGGASPYGATSVQYCSANDNSCNDANPAGEDATVYGHLNGTGTSGAWNACHSLNIANGGAGTYGITAWRVPKKSELKGIAFCSTGPAAPLADYTFCNAGSTSPTIDTAMFPNALTGHYWASSSNSNPANAWVVRFDIGLVVDIVKSNSVYVRCVSGP